MLDKAPIIEIPSLSDDVLKLKIGIVHASWNTEVVNPMKEAAFTTLSKAGFKDENILIYAVPGSFELPLGIRYLFELAKVDAVIALGCLIKGDTDHYHYIADAVSNTISQISSISAKPVGFGLLTVHNLQQAIDRAGGTHGNKGEEAALAVLHMLAMKDQIKQDVKPKSTIGFNSL
jgi:6,7-dimethyl-8-ribityllumazine synthase